jgi:hypothetical protein
MKMKKKKFKRFNIDLKSEKNLKVLQNFLFDYFNKNIKNIKTSYSILSNLLKKKTKIKFY